MTMADLILKYPRHFWAILIVLGLIMVSYNFHFDFTYNSDECFDSLGQPKVK